MPFKLWFHAQRPTVDCWRDVQTANNIPAKGPHRRPNRGFTFSGHRGDGCGMSFPLVVIIGIDLSRLMTFVEDDRSREDGMGKEDGKFTVIADAARGHASRAPVDRRRDGHHDRSIWGYRQTYMVTGRTPVSTGMHATPPVVAIL